MSVSQGSKILASDCVSTNTASTLVLRDSSGNFSAGTITSLLTSNRTTVGNFISLQQNGTECARFHLNILGTTSTSGVMTLILGNGLGPTQDKNVQGQLYIHKNTTGSYLQLTQLSIESGSFKLDTFGASNTEGIVTLRLGNDIAKTSSCNASGKIMLYNSKGNTGIIKTYTDGTTNFDYSVIVEDTLTILSDQSVISTTSSATTKYLFRIIPSMRYHKTNSGAHGWTDALNFKVSGKNAPDEENHAILEIGNNIDISYPNNLTGRIFLYDSNGNSWNFNPEYSSNNAYLKIHYGAGATIPLKLRNDGAIQGAFLVKVDTGNKTFTSSTSWFYTGAAVTIPAYCYYFIRGQAVYSTNGPTRVALSTNSAPTAGWEQAISYYGAQGYAGYVSLCGYTTAATTFYLHAVYNGASSNYARITGGYIQSWE